MKTQTKLTGKTALITGASKGIGREIALMLAEEGLNLILVARGLDDLHQTQKLVEANFQNHPDSGNNPQVYCVQADLGNLDEVSSLAEKTNQLTDKLDFLINNAGMAVSQPFEKTDSNIWNKLLAVNATGPFFLTQFLLPLLSASSSPVIINVSSVVGRKGYVHQAAYAASKHALMGFTKVLGRELQPKGIRVHAVSPGGVDTSMAREMRPDLDTSGLIKPGEVAEAVVFLLKFGGNAVIDEIVIRRKNGTAFD